MDKIACPKCGFKFELTEAVAGPLVAQQVEEARKHMQRQVEEAAASADRRVEEARGSLRAEAEAKARSAQAEIIAGLKRDAKDAADSERAMSEKLAAAQKAQAEAMAVKRKADDERREMALTIETKVSEGLLAARRQAEADAEGRIGLKLQEKELQIESLKKASEELRRKLEQGSQQIQGEVQELALEAALRDAFPSDNVEPIGKGVQGGDCLLQIAGGGSILFESKSTKAWANGWVPKLKDDGRAAKADALVIVTQALPKDWKDDFGWYDGVWVTLPKHAIALACALRAGLQEASAARRAGEGSETKAAQIYKYMTGPQFKSRVQAIVEAFTVMREDLDAERRAITKQWAKREAQIDRVVAGTVGMYGDLQAIAGRALAEVEGLDLKRLK